MPQSLGRHRPLPASRPLSYTERRKRTREALLSEGPPKRKTQLRVICKTGALVLLVIGGCIWQLASSSGVGRWTNSSPDDSEAYPRHLLDVEIGGRMHDCQPQEDTIKLIMVKKDDLTTDCTVNDGICLKKGKEWMIILYLIGVVYMFMALSIVCDEFFVPALECFVEIQEIDMDVAGATFMAAGGSMPELFTAIIGTFQKSDVGFAAIVGSAVFNVLFVIAVCAIASRDVLTLTWWPLFRDCSYYVFGLSTLVVFLLGPSKKEIETWEAAVLFVEYIGYAIFMKFNRSVYRWICNFKGIKVEPLEDGDAAPAKDEPQPPKNVSFGKPSTFRQGILQILIHNEHLADTAGVAAVSMIAGNLKETFEKLDHDKSGYIDDTELSDLLTMLGCSQDSPNVAKARKEIDKTGDGRICFEEFRKWYIASEARIEIKMRRVFEKFDTNGSGTIERHEVSDILKSLGHNAGEKDVTKAVMEMKACSTIANLEEGGASADHTSGAKPNIGDITFEQFDKWYSKSLFWQEHLHQNELEERAATDGFDIELPEDFTGWNAFWYVTTYPLCSAMYCTMPDVRREGRDTRGWAVTEFLLSLFWIALFSFCMVDWMTVASNTIGIPTPVAGVTLLAAGTSIPDLLSSYIVAQQGQGDMAVSSSIGSNIFDILVGLPLPWLAFSIYHGENVKIGTEGLTTSVMLLVLMLVAVITIVHCSGWVMTKSLGYSMLVLYLIFLIQDLLKQLPENDPVVSDPLARL